jgi:hypothetical protein
MRLGTMQDEDLESLVCLQLGVDQVPKSFANFVMEKSEGNPLFAEEFCADLAAKGYVRIEDGKLIIERDVSTHKELPEAVQNVLSSRIDQLQPAMQMVLKVASVLGHTFSKTLLEAVFPVQKDLPLLDGYLHKLLKLGIVREVSDSDYQVDVLLFFGLWFFHICLFFPKFRSPSLRVTVYNRLLFEQRLKLHTRVADELRQLVHTHFFVISEKNCICGSENVFFILQDPDGNKDAIASHLFRAVYNNHNATPELVRQALEALFALVVLNSDNSARPFDGAAMDYVRQIRLLLDSDTELSAEEKARWLRKCSLHLVGSKMATSIKMMVGGVKGNRGDVTAMMESLGGNK